MGEEITNSSNRPLRWAPILCLLALSAGARIIYFLAKASVIESEGAYYARVAENLTSGKGWTAIQGWGEQLLYPPLYSLLIAAVHLLGLNTEAAARTVSLVLGSLLVVPIYLLARTLYDDKVGLAAGAMTALHPILVGMSTAVFSESTYACLLFTALFFGVCAAKQQSYGRALAAGAVLGLAYMTRSEALVTTCFLAMVIFLAGWAAKPKAFRVAACLVVTFAIVGSPYVWFLKKHTGQFRLESKSQDNIEYGKLMLSGLTPDRIFHEVDDDLRPIGVSMRPDIENMRAAKFDVRTVLQFEKIYARANSTKIISGLFEHQADGGVFLIALVAIGLFNSPWDRKRTIQETIMIAFLILLILPLLAWFAFTSRFLVICLPLLIIWVAKGAIEFGRWSEQTLSGLGFGFGRKVGIVAASGAFVLLAWSAIGSFEDLREPDPALKAAGLEVKRLFPGKTAMVMDRDPVVAFYANGNLRTFPYCSPSTALRYIDSNKVEVVVLRETLDGNNPYYRDWIEKGIPDSRATLIDKLPSHQFGHILLYRWEPATNQQPEGHGQHA